MWSGRQYFARYVFFWIPQVFENEEGPNPPLRSLKLSDDGPSFHEIEKSVEKLIGFEGLTGGLAFSFFFLGR